MRQPFSRHGLATALAALVGLLLSSQAVAAEPAAPWVGKTLANTQCAGGQPTSGPFDYLNRPAVDGPLRIVEENHFDRGVETLTKGMSDTPMGDINFVLLAFPNHHRALQSATNFSLRHKRWPQQSKGRPAECYLQRAMKFSPRDPVPYKIYGYYMHRKGRLQVALEANQKVMELVPTDVMVQYNTGLILVELERYQAALKLAKPLYEAGLTLPGLKQKLVKAGVWEHSPEEVAAYKKHLRKKAAAGSSGGIAPDDEAGGNAAATEVAPSPATDDTSAPGQASELPGKQSSATPEDEKNAQPDTPPEDAPAG